MPTIHITTVIHAPMDRVYDLSRSITLHKRSMSHLQEEAIKGRTNGLIEREETVTWQAKHLGKIRRLTTRITEMNNKHEHHFKEIGNGTVAIDIMEFGTPYGWLGRMFERFYLNKYMTRLLQVRNEVIKEYAESEKWRVILD